ncbi:MAG: dCTP deaminase [Rickettsiales bacterium]|jgi:dCTP deaminase|nr:dCTP deaminase [Rickettsiales bacterium]
MVLGNRAILKALENKEILITPFEQASLQGTSYDIRLDGFFIDCDVESEAEVITNAASVAALYAKMPRIKSDEFVIKPGARALASTVERIGSLVAGITTTIHSKSSWARHGLEVCSCAGYGDPGYASHWTLEIFNKNSYPVRLEKGMKIAQITFYRVEGCDMMYASKYNAGGTQKELFSDEERFEMMTPKAIKLN